MNDMLYEPPPDHEPDNNHDHAIDADSELERDADMLPGAVSLLYQDMQRVRCGRPVSVQQQDRKPPFPGTSASSSKVTTRAAMLTPKKGALFRIGVTARFTYATSGIEGPTAYTRSMSQWTANSS